MTLFYHDKTLNSIIGNLRQNKQFIASTESCTGGLIATALTAKPGSSDFFKGGVSAYSNFVKMTLLGVPKSCLDSFGAVSKETAMFMAYGVKELMACDYGISITGIAGPSGGTIQKPVGTVWCGLSYKSHSEAHLLKLSGSRDSIRKKSTIKALTLLNLFIETKQRGTRC